MTGFAALQHDWLCRFSAIVLHTSTPIGHSTAGVQIGHLQDALHELRDSLKVSMEEASSEREQFEVQANAQAEVDKALYEVCPPSTLPLFLPLSAPLFHWLRANGSLA